jgi:hypothetical protein
MGVPLSSVGQKLMVRRGQLNEGPQDSPSRKYLQGSTYRKAGGWRETKGPCNLRPHDRRQLTKGTGIALVYLIYLEGWCGAGTGRGSSRRDHGSEVLLTDNYRTTPESRPSPACCRRAPQRTKRRDGVAVAAGRELINIKQMNGPKNNLEASQDQVTAWMHHN